MAAEPATDMTGVPRPAAQHAAGPRVRARTAVGPGWMSRSRPRAVAGPGLAVLAGLGVLAAGAIRIVAPAAAVTAPPDVGVPPPVQLVAGSAAGPAPASPAAPHALDIPALHVHAGIVPVTAPAGVLNVPDDPRLVGWWSPGARPASPTGTVVVSGHVDTAARGLGAFAALTRVQPGMLVRVSTGDGTLAYAVVARVRYPKAALPPEVFAQYGRARLALITCGGRFDPTKRSYQDNVVVFAVPAARSAT